VSAISLPDVEPAPEAPKSGTLATPYSLPATPLRLFGLEFSLDTDSLDALERLARFATRERLRGWFLRVRETEEVAMLVTCHRVELALLLRSADELDRWREVLPGPPNSWRLREGRALVRHLFRVAAGKESLARGEGEVRHQVRAAGRQVESRHPRPVLRELFTGAAVAAEELDPSVPTSRSIAAVATARLFRQMDKPRPDVLVIGSGTVGRQVVECLGTRARVTMLFHRNPPADDFLQSTGVRAVGLDQLRHELASADAAITAAKFGDRGLRRVDLPSDHPLLLIDLGMPRNIDPDVRALPNVDLVDLENLYTSAGPVESSNGPEDRLNELADRCSERLQGLLMEPWVAALRRGTEDIRRAELERARPFLGELSAAQELAVERLTRRLAARLLLPPTQRIRALPPGPEGDLRRRWATELLRPLPSDP
jgi:glutamyl-tRNA reductase